jgi:hypothetical protein
MTQANGIFNNPLQALLEKSLGNGAACVIVSSSVATEPGLACPLSAHCGRQNWQPG